ncbi:universal stress protein [Pseudoduganella sp. S-14]|jgi:nucleotide-binding universal stress UspA family protein|uniref:universal stress protein n=1 Tax=Pseudoduganella sp. S-14 TaxID=3404065 RepID=UPI003CF5A60D
MYKTILLHADAARSAPARLRLAAMLAEQQQAHLVCTAMTGISRYAYRTHENQPYQVIRPDLAQMATANASLALDKLGRLADSLGLHSCERRLINDDAYGGLLLQARYADLVVLSQADRDDPATGGMLQDLPEQVILNCSRPVLVVPFAGAFASIGKTVLVAWDGSAQATRAVTQALPVLRGARRVVVGMIDPVSGGDEHGEEPGADIATYLARHGIQVEVRSESGTGEAGEALLAMADKVGADLLVMGAYGHPRYREIMLGGATRTVLASATLPVLMSH